MIKKIINLLKIIIYVSLMIILYIIAYLNGIKYVNEDISITRYFYILLFECIISCILSYYFFATVLHKFFQK
jgi:antibiotic biosynthesis monooxygenase (ABM) superfamily enzyme